MCNATKGFPMQTFPCIPGNDRAKNIWTKNMSLGSTIATLRKAKGISLEDVEKLTQIDSRLLYKFENDQETIDPENLDQLSALFGTTPAVLLSITQFTDADPKILEDSDKFCRLVRRLTKLIQNYLRADEDKRLFVDKYLC